MGGCRKDAPSRLRKALRLKGCADPDKEDGPHGITLSEDTSHTCCITYRDGKEMVVARDRGGGDPQREAQGSW